MVLDYYVKKKIEMGYKNLFTVQGLCVGSERLLKGQLSCVSFPNISKASQRIVKKFMKYTDVLAISLRYAKC